MSLGELTVPKENSRMIHAVHTLLHPINYYYYKTPPLHPLKFGIVNKNFLIFSNLFPLLSVASVQVCKFNFFFYIFSLWHS